MDSGNSEQARPSVTFETLVTTHREPLRKYLSRMIGHEPDANDVLQDTLVKAVEKQTTLKELSSFRSWIFRIATTTALDHLRRQKRWRPMAQSYVEHACDEDADQRQRVIDSIRDPEFSYDVREHLSFCFACVGRSLAPEEQAAIVLREFVGCTNQEAATLMGLSESKLRHHLSDGRKSMMQTFDGLCSLVNKQGVCRQCASFRGATPAGRRGPELPVLQPESEPSDSQAAWLRRVSIAKDTHFLDGQSRLLHDVFFAMLVAQESNHT